jgi:uncharacterized membrane protein
MGTSIVPFGMRKKVLIQAKEQIMALDTFVVLANQYEAEADALADYNAVRKLYTNLGVIDTYDAAVLTRKADGKVKIVKRVEEPTRQGGAAGLGIGLATGAAIALFPALGIPVATGALGGGAVGASELLDTGTSGLLVVAAADVAGRVDAAITRAKKRVKTQMQADADALKKEIDSIPV